MYWVEDGTRGRSRGSETSNERYEVHRTEESGKFTQVLETWCLEICTRGEVSSFRHGQCLFYTCYIVDFRTGVRPETLKCLLALCQRREFLES